MENPQNPENPPVQPPTQPPLENPPPENSQVNPSSPQPLNSINQQQKPFNKPNERFKTKVINIKT